MKIALVGSNMKSAYCPAENTIKQILRFHLVLQGWNVEITRRLDYSFDVVAVRGSERWVIEVNSIKNNSLVNSFVSALGELLQRMDVDDPNTKYSVAFPDHSCPK